MDTTVGNTEDSASSKETFSRLSNRFFAVLENFTRTESPPTHSKDDVLLKFMEKTITKINYCLSSIYATQQILIKKGICSREELIDAIKDSQGIPSTAAGRDALTKMIEDNEINSILSMVDVSSTDKPDATNTNYTEK